jgi:hypothetical protein
MKMKFFLTKCIKNISCATLSINKHCYSLLFSQKVRPTPICWSQFLLIWCGQDYTAFQSPTPPPYSVSALHNTPCMGETRHLKWPLKVFNSGISQIQNKFKNPQDSDTFFWMSNCTFRYPYRVSKCLNFFGL